MQTPEQENLLFPQKYGRLALILRRSSVYDVVSLLINKHEKYYIVLSVFLKQDTAYYANAYK